MFVPLGLSWLWFVPLSAGGDIPAAALTEDEVYFSLPGEEKWKPAKIYLETHSFSTER